MSLRPEPAVWPGRPCCCSAAPSSQPSWSISFERRLRFALALGRNDLTADFACGMGLTVHIHIPFAGRELFRLIGGKHRAPFYRVRWRAALGAEPNRRRRIFALLGGPMEMRHRGRAR